ncbi:hypothetical protein N7448_009965 [Penicillium atrosanguineum]|uniref:Uncharacterized protein n=1 Tax=Penicillium atrosanguineum TaxID=1132637 RepID=A0A9W9TYQ3_9EURO|nr:uncharacterized protein N7443_007180 [Penicillium atrosanguineum]KAJ5118250.1 hypothetical protein N7526_009887 [Penicillium atrosanguineum]KAJ5119296.1 hypothetical protein N7448_009965 [Penicillium atrosanguineum]KAJ5296287.1 hypothetical protein N7443_007180 [Penicillium atrosanguineum]KAJ5299057.1 hypothetical protein N7476_010614 [Penicillium atrosanguineum]
MDSSVTIHHGPYDSIPDTASPGLKFLKRFLPAMDSARDSDDQIAPLFTPNAPIIIGSNPPTFAYRTTPLMQVRSDHFSHFHHDVHVAWDIDLVGPNDPSNKISSESEEFVSATRVNLYAPLPGNIRMKRTVLYEATSETIFADDPDQFMVKVREFSVIDLQGKDDEDLQVVEMRIFTDSRPVQARAAALHTQSAFGESATEAEPE